MTIACMTNVVAMLCGTATARLARRRCVGILAACIGQRIAALFAGPVRAAGRPFSRCGASDEAAMPLLGCSAARAAV